MACTPLGISIQRYEAMDFCGYLEGTTTSILIQYPSFDIMSYFGILKTFSYEVFVVESIFYTFSLTYLTNSNLI